jgi:hypothetical protein
MQVLLHYLEDLADFVVGLFLAIADVNKREEGLGATEATTEL